MENINDTYFDGQYKDLWRSIIPGELTTKEIDFLLPFFKLGPGSTVLDLMCGYGRHAIALAEKGISVTAVDNLDDYIKEIREIAEKEKLPLKAIRADVVKYKGDDVFDLILCMGNSLNFFGPEDCLTILYNIAQQLKSGGYLLINSWSIAEIAILQFKERTWNTIDNKKFIVQSQFLFHPSRIEFEHLIISPNGHSETKNGIDYVLSISELDAMFKKVGLECLDIYSIPGRKKFTIGEPRAYIIAHKP